MQKPRNTISLSELGAALKRLRAEECVTRERVATWIGSTPEKVALFEKGRVALDDAKIAMLPPLFRCESVGQMVKRKPLVLSPYFIENSTIGGVNRLSVARALFHLRHAADEGLGITQQDVANEIHCNESHIGMFEREFYALSEEIIKKLPGAFKCNPPTLKEMVKKASMLTWQQTYGVRETIGSVVKHNRTSRNMTQIKLADSIYATRPQLAEFETGKNSMGKEKVRLIPRVFGYTSITAMMADIALRRVIPVRFVTDRGQTL